LGNVDRYFNASETVSGICKANLFGLKLKKSEDDSFNLTINFDCSINIQRTKLLDFSVGLEMEMVGIPSEFSLDFTLRNHEAFITLYPNVNFPVIQTELSLKIINNSLNRLYEHKLFGSGWPLATERENPRFLADDNFMVVYDATHVDPRFTDM
jgi:hypothetical protein